MDQINKPHNMWELTEEVEAELFRDALIFFDTNEILNLYQYTEDSRDDFSRNLFAPLEGRLFLPEYVFHEFLKNKNSVSYQPIQSYKDLIEESKKDGARGGYISRIESHLLSAISKIDSDCRTEIGELRIRTSKQDKHPFFNGDIFNEIETVINNAVETLGQTKLQYDKFRGMIEAEINTKIGNIEEIRTKDSTKSLVSTHFKVLKGFDYTEIIKIMKDGVDRYAAEIPPGYMDGKSTHKKGIEKYGDLIIWKEIVTLAKEHQKPVILVSSDNKEDWFEKKTGTPRSELIREIYEQSDSRFWIYDFKSFVYKTSNVLKLTLGDSTVQEVDEISESIRPVFSDEERELITSQIIEDLDVENIELHDDESHEFQLVTGYSESGEKVVLDVRFQRRANTMFLKSILKSESKEVARKSYSSGTKRYLIFVYNDHEEAINQGDFCDSSFCRKKIKLFNNHLHLVVGHFSDSRYLTVFNTEIEFSNDKSG